MTSPLEAAARRAADAVRRTPATARWLLACDTDADGLAAGAVAALAFRRLGRPFTIRASREKGEAAMRALLAEPADGLVLLDKGSGHLPLLADLAAGRPIVVADHHDVALPPPPGIALVNPRAEGLDGSRDASAATAAVALALALCGDEALAWAPTGLVGAMGDRQDEGGWQGWNLEVAQRARRSGHLAVDGRPRLAGPDLAQAVARLEPPVPGLHGSPDAAARLLESLGIGRDAEADDLPAETLARLMSALLLRCLAAGPAPTPGAWMAEANRHAGLGMPLRTACRAADACGREGQAATGIAFLMGDKGARADALACMAADRQAVDAALAALRADLPKPRRAVQVGWTGRPAHSGPVADRALDAVPGARCPVVILALRPDGRVQASARATRAQAAAGLDLGRALAAAARRAGGDGGGHPEAAGAVVPADAADAFLEALDGELMDQGFLARLP